MINIDTKKIKDCGNNIIKLSKDLDYIFELVYNRIIDMPTKIGEWQGKSADNYVKALKIEKEQAIDLKNTLYEYGKTLVDNANKYEEAVNETIL